MKKYVLACVRTTEVSWGAGSEHVTRLTLVPLDSPRGRRLDEDRSDLDGINPLAIGDRIEVKFRSGLDE